MGNTFSMHLVHIMHMVLPAHYTERNSILFLLFIPQTFENNKATTFTFSNSFCFYYLDLFNYSLVKSCTSSWHYVSYYLTFYTQEMQYLFREENLVRKGNTICKNNKILEF